MKVVFDMKWLQLFVGAALCSALFTKNLANAEPILSSERTPPFPIHQCNSSPQINPRAPVHSKVKDNPDLFEFYLKGINPKYSKNYGVRINGELRIFSSYRGIAQTYKRWCSRYGVRWDWAFVQMILETNYLRYTGSVPPQNYNFAGLAAVDKDSKGENFGSLDRGVKAHCQHLAAYALVELPNKKCRRNEIEEVNCVEAKRTLDVITTIIQPNVCSQFGRSAQFTELGPDDFGPCSDVFPYDCKEDIVRWASGPGAQNYANKMKKIYSNFLSKLRLCVNLGKGERMELSTCLARP